MAKDKRVRAKSLKSARLFIVISILRISLQIREHGFAISLPHVERAPTFKIA